MCGIAGIVGASGRDVETLDRMVERMRHRGPDGNGWMSWDGLAAVAGRGSVPAGGTVLFGHARLAIIDLSDKGSQPMRSSDGRSWITYNGELYNYVELRAELEDLGHRFVGASDTEVLLAAWQEWGTSCLRRLIGMFAFAVFDTQARVVHLVRDPFGIKPLFYAQPRGFVFASEIPTLLEHPAVGRTVDPQILYDYLRWGLSDHDERTMIEGVRQVPAGSILSIDVDTHEVGAKRYWQLGTEPLAISREEAASELRTRFLESVRLHLRSDVLVGTALSGGIDSSSILAAARQVAGDGADLHSFGYVADDERFDEQRWMRIAADAAGAHLHEVRLGAGTVLAELDALIRAQGEPFGGTSVLAQRSVFRAAREAGVTVLLDGQGADELFGGYLSYLPARFAQLVRSGRVGSAARLAVQVMRMPGSNMSMKRAVRVAAGALPARARGPLLRLSGREPWPDWLERSWFEHRGVGDVGGGRPHTRFEDALEAAFTSTSLPSLLRYEDRNSMAFSRESRVPFLTAPLVEFVFSLPRDLLVDDQGVSKAVFRDAMRGLVPDPILDRRDKIGFTTPEDRWLKELRPFVETTLASPATSRLPGLNAASCRSAWGRRRSSVGLPVWRWVNAIRWSEVLDVAG